MTSSLCHWEASDFFIKRYYFFLFACVHLYISSIHLLVIIPLFYFMLTYYCFFACVEQLWQSNFPETKFSCCQMDLPLCKLMQTSADLNGKNRAWHSFISRLKLGLSSSVCVHQLPSLHTVFTRCRSPWMPLSRIFAASWASVSCGRRKGGCTHTLCTHFFLPRYLWRAQRHWVQNAKKELIWTQSNCELKYVVYKSVSFSDSHNPCRCSLEQTNA